MDFTPEELALIATAKAKGGKVWDDETLYDIKQRIKSHYRNGGEGHCCYCKRRFKGEFKMDIDIEHILPKSRYTDYIFEMFNLNISCKRCNMEIKKERIDFLKDAATIIANVKHTNQYHIIHPNFDNYFEHMDLDVNIKNEKEMVKFTAKKPKGTYTYNFFKLNELETDTFNEAQGVKLTKNNQDLVGIPADLRDEVKELTAEL